MTFLRTALGPTMPSFRISSEDIIALPGRASREEGKPPAGFSFQRISGACRGPPGSLSASPRPLDDEFHLPRGVLADLLRLLLHVQEVGQRFGFHMAGRKRCLNKAM